MARAVVFKKIGGHNRFPVLARNIARALDPKDSIVHHTIRFIARKIKTLQRKAPKKPRDFGGGAQDKTLYGYRASYNPRSKKFQQGTRSYRKKGLYSRPGSPPFYHRSGETNPFLTMRIVGTFDQKGYSMTWKSVYGRRRGSKLADSKVVGPAVRPSKVGIPIPILHEYGGVVRWRGASRFYEARNGARITRKAPGVARYAERPFVRPGARMGADEAWVKYHQRKFTRIAGMRAKHVVKMRSA